MVAKSYQNLEIISEPFTQSGRQYVKVLTKSKTEKTVRWYSPSEYHKLYPETSEISTCNQKIALGFINDYITIYKGATYEEKPFFKEVDCRYCRFWGWYSPSTQPIPTNLPEGIEPITLHWSQVGTPSGSLKPEDEVKVIIDNLLYPIQGEFYGEIASKVSLTLTVQRSFPIEGAFGLSYFHTFTDSSGREFIWTTQARNWESGSTHKVSAIIKDHQTYKGRKQTVLKNVREVA